LAQLHTAKSSSCLWEAIDAWPIKNSTTNDEQQLTGGKLDAEGTPRLNPAILELFWAWSDQNMHVFLD